VEGNIDLEKLKFWHENMDSDFDEDDIRQQSVEHSCEIKDSFDFKEEMYKNERISSQK
jgi:hypothetical protein